MDLNSLRPSDCVFLHALLSIDGKNVAFMRSTPEQVAPNEAYYWHMVGALERRGVVMTLSHTQAADAYGRGSRSPAHRYDLAPGLPVPKELKRHLESQLNSIRDSKIALVAYGSLWRELALAELEAYIEWELAIHRFDAGWSGSLLEALEEGLETFSTAQMFYFCWTTVRDLASQHLRNPAPFETYKTYLQKTLAGKISRAAREGWEVKAYSRQWRRAQSAVVDTFSNRASGLGERFLLSTPSHQSLSSLF